MSVTHVDTLLRWDVKWFKLLSAHIVGPTMYVNLTLALDYSVTFNSFLVNRVSEPLVRFKMVITLELKLCLSNFRRGIKNQNGYQGTNIEFSRVQLIYF